MSADALPCIVCGVVLPNVSPEWSDNQPSEGTAFITHGHYGSTVFDPMNGNLIEITVCDECLKKASEQQRVLLSRDYKPVRAVLEGSRHPMTVGHTKAERLPVLWDYKANLEDDDEALHIEAEEVGVIKGVEWAPAFKPKEG